MKQIDLRIGNIIYIPKTDQEAKISLITEASIVGVNKDVIGLGSLKINELEPIILTEKRLLNFGFIKFNGRHGVYFKHKKQDLVRVWAVSEDNTQWGLGRKDLDSRNRHYNTHWIVLNLKYVHELQNLFLDITKEELKALAEKTEQTEASTK